MIATNCIFTIGYNHILLQDLQKQKFYWITSDFHNYLNSHNACLLNEEENEILKELYFKNVILDVDKKDMEYFPDFPLDYYSKSQIQNAVIEINDYNKNTLQLGLSELIKCLCKHIEIRFYNSINLEFLDSILQFVNVSTIETIDILVPFENELFVSNLLSLKKQFPRIHWIYFHFVPTSYKTTKYHQVLFTHERINNASTCGVISPFYFTCNIPHFTESQLHNTCLNRKICIDADGEIKNCPSMKQSYGNIKDTTLIEAMEKPGFKDLWFICKDKIDVCKDCEFRYMCTDCRAFIKDPENIYSQPAKCPYNPYIAKWQGEEGYVPIEECGTYTKEKGFVVNKRKVNKLNKEIWGE